MIHSFIQYKQWLTLRSIDLIEGALSTSHPRALQNTTSTISITIKQRSIFPFAKAADFLLPFQHAMPLPCRHTVSVRRFFVHLKTRKLPCFFIPFDWVLWWMNFSNVASWMHVPRNYQHTYNSPRLHRFYCFRHGQQLQCVFLAAQIRSIFIAVTLLFDHWFEMFDWIRLLGVDWFWIGDWLNVWFWIGVLRFEWIGVLVFDWIE